MLALIGIWWNMISKSLISMKYVCLQIWGDYTSTFAGIYHKSCKDECPNQCTNKWEYWDNGWHVDNSIKISCGKMLRCYMILFLWFQTISCDKFTMFCIKILFRILRTDHHAFKYNRQQYRNNNLDPKRYDPVAQLEIWTGFVFQVVSNLYM